MSVTVPAMSSRFGGAGPAIWPQYVTVMAARSCGRSVSNYSVDGGVLLYVGKLGGQDITLTGTTSCISISATRDWIPFYATNTMHVQASMDSADLKWETGATVLPVDPQALLALAKRHQAEYDELRESFAVLRALGG